MSIPSISKIVAFGIVGKLIKELSGTKNIPKANSLNIPEFIGTLEVRHSIPGRVRFYIPILKENNSAKYFLETKLGSVESIDKIKVNTVTGTVVIEYKKEGIDSTVLVGAILKMLNLEDEIMCEKKSLITREATNIKQALNMAIYNKTKGIADLQSIYILTAFVLGIWGIRKSPAVMPNGYNMMRWVYKEV